MEKFSTLIREDWNSHGRDWTRPGFRALAVYRLGVWHRRVRWSQARWVIGLFYRWFYRYCRNIYGIDLPDSARIGRGVIFEHQGGIVVHPNTIIGDRCVVRQNCTLAARRLDMPDEAPNLENDVDVGAGAAILGSVTLGMGATVGANAVVLIDVPPGALALGIPAKIRAGSYRGTKKDI